MSNPIVADLKALLDEEVEKSVGLPMQEGDITIRMVMDEYHIKYAQASRVLESMVKDGKVEKIWVVDQDTRRRINAYRSVKKAKK